MMPNDAPRWLKSLELRNFQKHENTQLEFAPGINIIRGRNNAGKTSIARAIRLLVYNQPRLGVNDDLIRWGKDSCFVRMEMSDGSWVIREKGEGVNRYVVDSPLIPGRRIELNGFGTAVPPEVTIALGFGPLTLAKTSGLELNIASQGETSFMLSESSPEIARWMYALTSLDDVRAAIDSLSKDHRQHGRFISEQEGRIEMLDGQIDDLAHLDSWDQQLTEIEAAVEGLGKLQARLGELEALLDEMVELRNKAVPIKRRRAQLRLILEAILEEDTAKLEDTGGRIEILEGLDQRLDELQPKIAQIHKRLSKNLKISKAPLDDVERASKQLWKLADLAEQIDSKTAEIDRASESHGKSTIWHTTVVERYEDVRDEMFRREDGSSSCPFCGHLIEDDEMDHILEDHDE